MTKTINTPEGEQTMLLGYEVIRFLAKPVQEDKTELDQIEDAALIAFNCWNKRNDLPAISKDLMVAWFDDLDVYTDVINAVKSFMENFTQRVSEPSQTPAKGAKK